MVFEMAMFRSKRMNKENVEVEVTNEEIALCAYHVWEDQGRPAGRDQEIWLQAEAWLNAVRREELTRISAKRGRNMPAIPPVAEVKKASKVKASAPSSNGRPAVKKSPATANAPLQRMASPGTGKSRHTVKS
jgi:hypothetical protein